MTSPGRPGEVTVARPARPIAVDIVAALLVFGGLFGARQLLVGDFAITGSLPAKGPLLGVSAILYASSVAMGALIRTGRGWLPAINLAGAFAIVYLAAFGHASTFALGIAHGAAALLLVRTRAWFAAMGRWRAEQASGDPWARLARPETTDQDRSGAPEAGGRRRPSGRR